MFVGRNNYKGVKNAYRSIKIQNYTNYRIVHIDDNSQNYTMNKVLLFL